MRHGPHGRVPPPPSGMPRGAMRGRFIQESRSRGFLSRIKTEGTCCESIHLEWRVVQSENTFWQDGSHTPYALQAGPADSVPSRNHCFAHVFSFGRQALVSLLTKVCQDFSSFVLGKDYQHLAWMSFLVCIS